MELTLRHLILKGLNYNSNVDIYVEESENGVYYTINLLGYTRREYISNRGFFNKCDMAEYVQYDIDKTIKEIMLTYISD